MSNPTSESLTKDVFDEALHAKGDLERASKRIKLNIANEDANRVAITQDERHVTNASVREFLPPSRVLLGRMKPKDDCSMGHTEEVDVGISEYLSPELPPIHAIIKQRYVPTVYTPLRC